MMKEMKNKMKKDAGFTLAELLIVVAIIAVLVAIAIPIFTTQLEKSKESTDMANVRSAYADVMAEYIQDADHGHSMFVSANQTQDDWQTSGGGNLTIQVNGKESQYPIPAVTKKNGGYLVAIDASGEFTITQKSGS